MQHIRAIANENVQRRSVPTSILSTVTMEQHETLTPKKEPRLSHRSHWHYRPMIYSAGDLGIEIDFGLDQPGAILQRKKRLLVRLSGGW